MTARRKRFLALALGVAALAAALALSWRPLAHFYRKITRQPDENGIYEAQGHWAEALSPLNESSAEKFAAKLNALGKNLLTGSNRVFWAVVPDKGWYLQNEGYPTLDYEAMTAILRGQINPDYTEVDLFGALTLDDYYRTDSHWRQERLQPVLDRLGGAMGFAVDLDMFAAHSAPNFVGAYGKSIQGKPPQEDLVYLTSPATEAATADNYQAPDVTAVYDVQRLETAAPYDVFLSGATPIVSISCPQAETDRELVIFRDSFSSSLAPLLCGQYRTITLVDLRYMVSSLVPDYLAFTDQDVLFLYSTWVVNNSAMLR